MVQPRVLLVILEYTNWKQSRHVSYCAQIGLAEALRSNGIDCTVLTTPWLKQATDIVANQKYDQVWVDIVHSNLGERVFQSNNFLEWLAGLAPVRLGLIAESLRYSENEKQLLPILHTRHDEVHSRLNYLTHIAACDELDANELAQQMPSFWWPQAVPEQDIMEPGPLPHGAALFGGSVYGERSNWLAHPALKGVLAYLPPPESNSLDPLRFRALHWTMQIRAWRNPAQLAILYREYIESLQTLRHQLFTSWLAGLRRGSAVVNLPHFVKTYAGRVFEGAAAGRPIISWHIPDRPRNEALFNKGSEILLFPADDPDCQLLQKLQSG